MNPRHRPVVKPSGARDSSKVLTGTTGRNVPIFLPPSVSTATARPANGRSHLAPTRGRDNWARDAQRTWDAFRLCFFAVFPRVRLYGTSLPFSSSALKGGDKKGRKSRCPNLGNAAEAFRWWLLQSTAGMGSDRVTAILKEWAHNARARALGAPVETTTMRVPGLSSACIEGTFTHPDHAAQWARLGRALPPASRKKVEATLEQHKADFLRDFHIDHAELDEVFYFCRDLGRRAARPQAVSIALREKASTECSRLKGGQLQALADLAKVEMAALASDLWGDDFAEEMPYGIGVDDWDLTILVDCALREASRLRKSPPECRVIAIPELGGKVRVATTGPAPLTLAGDALRKLLWPVLSAIPEIDIQAESCRGEGLVAMFDQHDGEILYSADLDRATDLIPHDLAWAAFAGVIEGLGLSAASEPALIGKALLGPLNLTYPDGTKITSKGGIPMGMPLSWFVLSLIQMYWIHGRNRDLLSRTPAAKVRGDDLLVAWTNRRCDEYEADVVRFGGSPNRSKSFRSPVGGVFAEICVIRDVSSHRPYVPQPGTLGEYFPSGFFEQIVLHKLRILSDAPVRFLIPRPTSSSNRTPEDYLGPACSDSLAWCRPRAYKALAGAILSVNYALTQKIRRFGIPLLAPRMIGGAGFPHPRGFARAISSAPVDFRRCLAARLATGKTKYAIERIWYPRIKRWAEDFVKQEAKADEKSRVGRLGSWIAVPRSEVMRRQGGQLAVWSRVFGGQIKSPKDHLVQLGSVRANLRKLRPPKVPHAFLPKLKGWSEQDLRMRFELAEPYLYVDPARWESSFACLKVQVEQREGGEWGNIATWVALSGRGTAFSSLSSTDTHK